MRSNPKKEKKEEVEWTEKAGNGKADFFSSSERSKQSHILTCPRPSEKKPVIDLCSEHRVPRFLRPRYPTSRIPGLTSASLCREFRRPLLVELCAYHYPYLHFDIQRFGYSASIVWINILQLLKNRSMEICLWCMCVCVRWGGGGRGVEGGTHRISGETVGYQSKKLYRVLEAMYRP